MFVRVFVCVCVCVCVEEAHANVGGAGVVGVGVYACVCVCVCMCMYPCICLYVCCIKCWRGFSCRPTSFVCLGVRREYLLSVWFMAFTRNQGVFWISRTKREPGSTPADFQGDLRADCEIRRNGERATLLCGSTGGDCCPSLH